MSNKFSFNPFNILGYRNSPPTSEPSASQPNQPLLDFNYDNDNIKLIPHSLVVPFNNLKTAINNKKKILEKYKGLYATLQSMDKSLDTYISNHAIANQKLSELTTEKKKLELERDNLKSQSKPEDVTKIAELNEAIKDKENQINQFEEQQLVNDDKMKAIGLLLEEATNEINNMYPINDEDFDKLVSLINGMKTKLGSVPVVQEPEVDIGEFYGNPQRRISESNFDAQNDNSNTITTRKSVGGYRYSPSSQMRRKSTARRSSSSGSSSSKRRRNKKRTAKKIMSGGKRMKKKRATKRKIHKKC